MWSVCLSLLVFHLDIFASRHKHGRLVAARMENESVAPSAELIRELDSLSGRFTHTQLQAAPCCTVTRTGCVRLVPARYIGLPILSADIGLYPIYQYQHKCLLICADI